MNDTDLLLHEKCVIIPLNLSFFSNGALLSLDIFTGLSKDHRTLPHIENK